MKLSAPSPAKINLYLDVIGRRADGYHEIDTVFLPLDALADTVSLETRPTPGIEVHCDAPGVPNDDRNLCWRAASAFAAAAGCEPRWRISIAKRIPVAAGLGGGSSNAATLLLLLHRAVSNSLDTASLMDLAAGLGADVPFFLNPCPSRAAGIGERLRPVPCRVALPIVLLNAGFPVSAAWTYRETDRTTRPAAPGADIVLNGLDRGDSAAIARGTYNALEFAVCRKFPLVEMMLEFLRANGCQAARVSGSGPTVFGIFPGVDSAALLGAARREFGDSIWTCACKAGTPSAGGPK
ncbi:MAG: 4-(cytidine 5'-diphospho)-2-C-methyl-D-erythritol kinase [Lentisphaerae bacterium RIFOXYB12_FULL_65_16]|nr:MAG: 4-(cytidine 5'-diphospho)-2-C-methyl-D-erythritol kinase [Lentisphaerae bacterium RIFOXYA12_64_32]OGV90505.1 MAG: 4-(cytidine 5'-diphospho)-2-C-methyl-D-erythritol kinase [Lentisphaerae bacterium RIFOXYB12_FULL_65_16]